MTDCAFLLAVLGDGEPHQTMEIVNASIAERSCGLTVHSRAAELRKRGYVISTEEVGHAGHRKVFTYQLLSSPREADPGTGSTTEPRLEAPIRLDSQGSSASRSDVQSSAKEGRVDVGRHADPPPLPHEQLLLEVA